MLLIFLFFCWSQFALCFLGIQRLCHCSFRLLCVCVYNLHIIVGWGYPRRTVCFDFIFRLWRFLRFKVNKLEKQQIRCQRTERASLRYERLSVYFSLLVYFVQRRIRVWLRERNNERRVSLYVCFEKRSKCWMMLIQFWEGSLPVRNQKSSCWKIWKCEELYFAIEI